MKLLSLWANHHPWKARFIIILLYIPINISGLAAGIFLSQRGVYLDEVFLFIISVITIYLWIFSPQKASYYKRKIFHTAMIVCTYCLICFLGNQIYNPRPALSFNNTILAVSNNRNSVTILSSETVKPAKEYLNSKKLVTKKVEEKPMPDWLKIILVTLTVLVTIGLLYLLAALSCTIACNGSEAIAWLVLLTGALGIVFGAFKLIQLIIRGKQKKKKRKQSQEQPA